MRTMLNSRLCCSRMNRKQIRAQTASLINSGSDHKVIPPSQFLRNHDIIHKANNCGILSSHACTRYSTCDTTIVITIIIIIQPQHPSFTHTTAADNENFNSATISTAAAAERAEKSIESSHCKW